MKEGDLDGRLSKYAASLERRAAETRALIGRLRVPSFSEWQAYGKRVDVAQAVGDVLHGNGFRRNDIDAAYNKIMADDDFYAKWQKQLQQEEDDYNRQLEHKRSRRELLGLPEYEVDEDVPF